MSAAPPPGAPLDVAIVGAGPVGLLLGAVLAAEGVAVAVFDARADISTRPRAIGIHPPGLAALERAGVADGVLARATRIRRATVVARGRTLVEHDFGAAAPVTLPQHETERLLAERLEALRPGSLRRSTTVSSIRAAPDRVDLRLESPAESTECSARLLIGADGHRSAARAALGASWRRMGRATDYAMLDTAAVLPGEHAILHLEGAGVVEVFPLPDGRERWVIRRSTAQPLGGEEFAAIVRERTGTAIHLEPDAAPVTFVARQGWAHPLARGRIALVGDAAHELSPIGGQGMNLGWLDAIALADAVALALARPRDSEPFGRYAAERAVAARIAMRRAAFNMAMGAPLGAPALAARSLIVRTLARGPLRRALVATFLMRGL